MCYTSTLEDILRKVEEVIPPGGWRGVLLPIPEDSVNFSQFSG